MSEQTPLLSSISEPTRHVVKRRKMNYGFWIPIVLFVTMLISAVTGLALHIGPQIGDLVDQMCEFNVQSVGFAGLQKDGGIDLVIKGQHTIDYDALDDQIARKAFKVGGFSLHSLSLKLDTVDMLVYDDVYEKYNDLGRVSVEPFKVGIRNKQVTPLKLLMTVYPNSDSVLGVLKKMIQNPDAQIKLYGDASIRIMVFNGFMPISKVRIPMDFALPTHLINLDKENVKVKGFSVEQGDDGIHVDFETVIQNVARDLNIPLGFFVPSVNWKLLLNDCNDLPTIPVLEFSTGKMELSSTNPLNFGVSASVGSLPDSVNVRCDDKKSPLTRFLSSAVDDSLVKFTVSASKDNKFPVMVNRILEKMTVPVSFGLDVKDKLGSLLKNVTMEDIAFQFMDPSNEPTIDGNLKIFLSVPRFLRTDVNVTDIRGTADLLYESSKFGEINLKHWKPATTDVLDDDEENEKNYLVLIQAQLEHVILVLTDIPLFEKIVQKVLGSGSVDVDIDALVDLLVSSFIGQLTVEKVNGKGSASIGV
ncbi:unnamed protein product [Kuraishia capsulata CBS 1993]|uniref:Uncharacterized protein n=1 Tax=Kuraishia capsulata CBS 1993 TaxID=1382522 RepID=W6MQP4_9ASCO|nr:uncharacterized protein KUCA_T00003560001 [Kuraishia capsulata CBS 1993]CDK27582.1 unnamed protein product [Kuraishia capsulata CBS 1993]